MKMVKLNRIVMLVLVMTIVVSSLFITAASAVQNNVMDSNVLALSVAASADLPDTDMVVELPAEEPREESVAPVVAVLPEKADDNSEKVTIIVEEEIAPEIVKESSANAENNEEAKMEPVESADEENIDVDNDVSDDSENECDEVSPEDLEDIPEVTGEAPQIAVTLCREMAKVLRCGDVYYLKATVSGASVEDVNILWQYCVPGTEEWNDVSSGADPLTLEVTVDQDSINYMWRVLVTVDMFDTQ